MTHPLPAATTSGVTLPGFADACTDSQAVFRTLLDALAHPGRLYEVHECCGVPPGLSPAMTAVLLTLVDIDTPLWLPNGTSAETCRFLRFHCGSHIVQEPRLASFVAVPAGHDMPAFAQCKQGDPAYPERSATLIIDVPSLQGGEPMWLSGPGIEDVQILCPRGLPHDFIAQWQSNTRLFPLGVDVILTQGRLICGLPRTCRIAMEN